MQVQDGGERGKHEFARSFAFLTRELKNNVTRGSGQGMRTLNRESTIFKSESLIDGGITWSYETNSVSIYDSTRSVLYYRDNLIFDTYSILRSPHTVLLLDGQKWRKAEVCGCKLSFLIAYMKTLCRKIFANLKAAFVQ